MNFRHLSSCCSVHINTTSFFLWGPSILVPQQPATISFFLGKVFVAAQFDLQLLLVTTTCNSLKEHIRIMLVTSPPKDHHNPSLEAGCPLRPRSQTYSSYSSCHSSPSRTTCAGCLLPIHSRPVFCSECFKVQYPNLQRFPNNNVVFLISVRYCSVRCKLTSFSSHKGDCKKKNL